MKKDINRKANIKFVIFILITVFLIFLRITGYLPSLF